MAAWSGVVRWRRPWVFWAILAVLGGFSGFLRADAGRHAISSFHASVEPLLRTYCFDCHGDGIAKGKVAFDGFASDAELVEQRDLWWRVLKNVRAGLMPAEDGPRLTAEERARLEHWIKYEALGLDPQDPDPGQLTLRRLNRVEYGATVRDLLGIEFDSEAEFPADDTGHGFDNLGEVLTTSPLLFEKYLQAAETIVDKAIPRFPTAPAQRVIPGREFQRPGGRSGSDLRVGSQAALTHRFQVSQNGRYAVVLDLGVRRSFDFDPARGKVRVSIDGVEQRQWAVAWSSPGTKVEAELDWTAGPHEVRVELNPEDSETPQDAGKGGVQPSREAAPTGVVQVPSSLKEPQAAVPATLPPPEGTYVDLRINTLQVTGPLDRAHWRPTKNYARFFTRPEPPTEPVERERYLREILRTLASRAFRRPVDEPTLDKLVGLAVAIASQPGRRLEDGFARAAMAVLASPRFVFRLEQPLEEEAGRQFPRVDEYALASRLSYFLWSSMPDRELTDLAARGDLRKQLPQQVQRLLNDERSKAFVRNFAGQWLQARDIQTVSINVRTILVQSGRRDADLKTAFDAAMRRSLRTETETYFEYVLRQDRSVLEFVDSDYAFVNARLAAHYGLPPVKGDELRRVTLPEGSPRGGVLTQGTVLAVTSNPTRTSPVKRGLFVLENFLGQPPPPPPANIPPLEDSAHSSGGRELTLREALAEHRANPLCSSCHARMDPIGFALEHFDAMGQWRERDARQAIDPSGQLVTGESFANIQELKRVITGARRLDFYRGLTEKMLTYAIGRGLTYQDVIAVDEIVARLESQQGRFSALLTGIIESAPFQKQRRPPPVQAGTLTLHLRAVSPP